MFTNTTTLCTIHESLASHHLQEQVIFVGFSKIVYISQSALSVMDFTNCHITLVLYTFQSSVFTVCTNMLA